MNKRVLANIFNALKNPTVLVSVISQLAAILLFMGFDIDEQALMTGVGTVMSLLGSFGIISKIDLSKNKLETKDLFCPIEKKITQFVKINGKMVCPECGHVYEQTDELLQAAGAVIKKAATRKAAPKKSVAQTKSQSAAPKKTATRKAAPKKSAAQTKTQAATTKKTATRKAAAKKEV